MHLPLEGKGRREAAGGGDALAIFKAWITHPGPSVRPSPLKGRVSDHCYFKPFRSALNPSSTVGRISARASAKATLARMKPSFAPQS